MFMNVFNGKIYCLHIKYYLNVRTAFKKKQNCIDLSLFYHPHNFVHVALVGERVHCCKWFTLDGQVGSEMNRSIKKVSLRFNRLVSWSKSGSGHGTRQCCKCVCLTIYLNHTDRTNDRPND